MSKNPGILKNGFCLAVRTVSPGMLSFSSFVVLISTNKENNVFKDALGVKGLGFKHHGNHPDNHGSLW